jgi:small subunit ribosomal protein S5
MSSREGEPGQQPAWTPRSRLGLLVMQGKVSSLHQIFSEGMRIQEPEVVKTLLPDLESEVVGVRVVQKQTDAGELTRFSAVVAVGNRNGWFGVGDAKGPQMRIAIEKATNQAMLNIIPVNQGCGSWECRCGQRHSTPFKVEGKCGSVRVVIIPGPRGLGLVAGETAKRLLALAGIRDAWTRTFGSTSTVTSIAYAVYDALLKLHVLVRR